MLSRSERDKELFPRNPHKFEVNTPAAYQGLHTEQTLTSPPFSERFQHWGELQDLPFTAIYEYSHSNQTQLRSNSSSYPSGKPKHTENSTSPKKTTTKKLHLSACLIVTKL